MNVVEVDRVLRAFESAGVKYVVFGGAAMNILGLPRATQDLDLFVAATAENVELVKSALRSVYEDPNIAEITVEDLLGDYPAVQYIPPVGDFRIDIFTRLGEMFSYENVEAMRIPFGDLNVNVATPRMLFRMKRDTVRLRDRADAERLAERFGFGDS